MKKLIVIFVFAALTSCVTPQTLSYVKMGWNKHQVIKELRQPDEVSAIGNVQYLKYEMYGDWYFVKLINNKVVSYGRVGDFNSTKNPTWDLNITTKKR